ncbi:MAG: esterase-like activity of phytase family protein [Pyrinomonadaceae bacterium]|nr:esterase-like activity of phytase family protein [Phycisphaerales bacterium]
MAGIEFLAEGRLAWDASDRSGLTDTLAWKSGSMPHDRLGSFGSGLAYSGRDNLYFACADRGPADGAAAYACRVQVMRIEVLSTPGNGWQLRMTCEATRLLKDSAGRAFTGAADRLNLKDAALARRLDPEGIRVARDGSLYISDEYGPFVDHYSASGVRLARLPASAHLLNSSQSGEPAGELPPIARQGRQPNRGMEGLAISPEGMRLYGIMQSPLIQDGGLDPANKRVGTNARIVEYSLRDGAEGPRRQFVYCMEHPAYSLNEILSVSDRTFLVLERDGKGGTEAKFRAIYKITLDNASDVSDRTILPVRSLPASVRAVGKSMFLDLMRPEFGLAGKLMPEKIEGLTFGPDLPDGRHVLLVSIDNDFIDGQDSIVWAFAIEPNLLPDFALPIVESQQPGR